MSKQVLIITSSYRKNGNSNLVAAQFARGAAESGHTVETVSLAEKTIGFCRGCLACQKTGRCVIADDAREIAEKMKQAEVIVFATPIYYYELSGQLKTMLDRANPLYDSDYHFREIYFISAAAEDEPTTPERALAGLGGWIDCFPKAQLKGTVFAGGVNNVGDVASHPALQTAYEMGQRV